MAHQISPTSFRKGKTSLWSAAGLTPSSTRLQPSSPINAHGLSRLLKYQLRRKRLFVVRAAIEPRVWNSAIKVRLLYMPRMKLRPRSHSLGQFSRFALYKNIVGGNTSQGVLAKAMKYVDERRFKVYKFRRSRRPQVNRWITRRMLRGSKFSARAIGPRPPNYSKKQYYFGDIFYFFRGYKRRSKRWFRRLASWYFKRSRVRSRLNTRGLAHRVSSIMNQKIHISAVNVFSYLAKKQMIGFRSHQEHFWHRRYRHYRFFYDNYYDIVNSLFLVGIIANSENLFLDILRMMMPRIRKIRRFLYFIDAVLKNLLQIRSYFACFRLTLTGKIRGGTKRTKTLSIGFGYLPYQSINLDASVAFISYRHKFGEFGVRLLMNRTFHTHDRAANEQRWVVVNPFTRGVLHLYS